MRALAIPLVFLLSGPVASPLLADTGTVVAIALDTSGSIGQPGLDRARELALGILPYLGPGSEAAVFTFDDRSRLVRERTSRPEELSAALSGVTMSGRYTALYDALYDASRYLRDAPGTRKAIVLLTDGHDENSALTIEDGLRVAAEGHIPVYAVGVGRVDERVLRRIAKLTGGEYFPPGAVSPQALASRIAAGSAGAEAAGAAAPLPAPPRPAARAPSASSKTTSAAVATPAPGPAPVAAPAPARRASRGLWVGLGVALLALGGLGWLALGRRSRPRCPTCRRDLPNRLTECAFCSRAPAGAGAAGASLPKPSTADRTIVHETAPTVLARVGAGTDEYLEKTVVLRERPVLSVTRGPGSGQVYDVKTGGTTSLGRAKVNDIILRDDVAISSEHCRIRPEEGKFVLHDLKSTNGTFVNDRRVTRQPLSEGDTIQVGETYLQFKLEHRRS